MTGRGVQRKVVARAPDGDDIFCFPASEALLYKVAGCSFTNTGFDGASYQRLWPNGNTKVHPTPFQFSSPETGPGYSVQYAQAAFETDSGLFYASTHQSPLYPGTGSASETGVGNIVNVPLRPMSGSSQFRLGVTQRILPALDAFRPELMLISAGFDAHKRDPLAQLLLDEEDYTWITEQLLEIAYRHAGGRLVSTLEGGYDLAALGASAAAHLRVLMSV